jgi:hypothetical protein
MSLDKELGGMGGIERLGNAIKNMKACVTEKCMGFECYGIEKILDVPGKYADILCELLQKTSEGIQRHSCLTEVAVYFKITEGIIRLNILVSGKDYESLSRELLQSDIIEHAKVKGGSFDIRPFDDASGTVIVVEITKIKSGKDVSNE